MGTIEIIWDGPRGIRKVVIVAGGITARDALGQALARLGLALDQGYLAVRINSEMYSIVRDEDLLEPGQYVLMAASR